MPKPIRRSLGALLLCAACAPAAPAQSQKTILFIGDSHSTGTFGKTFDGLLRTLPNARVATYAVCSATPDWFWSGQSTYCGAYFKDEQGHFDSPQSTPTPKIVDLLNTHQPTLTIIALGANQTGNNETSAHNLAAIIRHFGGACVWVGPPSEPQNIAAGLPAVYAALAKGTKNLCGFVDSRPYTPFPFSGTNVHFDYYGSQGSQIAKNWAQQVFDSIFPKSP